MWKLWTKTYRKIVFLDNMTILLSLLTHFINFATVLLHYITTYDINSFLSPYQLSCFFSTVIYKWLTFWDRWKRFLQIWSLNYIISLHDLPIGWILLSKNKKNFLSSFIIFILIIDWTFSSMPWKCRQWQVWAFYLWILNRNVNIITVNWLN